MLRDLGVDGVPGVELHSGARDRLIVSDGDGTGIGGVCTLSPYYRLVLPSRRFAKVSHHSVPRSREARDRCFINCVLATIVPHAATLPRERCRPNACAEPRQLLASGWRLVPAPPL